MGEPSVWACTMRSLRRLHVLCLGGSPKPWTAEPGDLPCLQELELDDSVVVETYTHLPPSLTKLRLDVGAKKAAHPVKLASLSRLHSLALGGAREGLDLLAGLPSLRRLSLLLCSSWPACLSQLTALEALELDNTASMEVEGDTGNLADAGAAAEALAAALPRLARLSHLLLVCRDSFQSRRRSWQLWPACAALPGCRGGTACPLPLAPGRMA
ncbi:hypothetical protein ABPG75_003524 [Micractinium tetrahymenae]